MVYVMQVLFSRGFHAFQVVRTLYPNLKIAICFPLLTLAPSVSRLHLYLCEIQSPTLFHSLPVRIRISMPILRCCVQKSRVSQSDGVTDTQVSKRPLQCPTVVCGRSRTAVWRPLTSDEELAIPPPNNQEFLPTWCGVLSCSAHIILQDVLAYWLRNKRCHVHSIHVHSFL